MLLSLSGVAKIYGARVIFKGVTLSVAPGTVTLLVGANGAGKSTLLRLMAGLGQASAGEIAWQVPEAELGYLGHATFLYPGLTARENLAFWRDVYSLPARTEAGEDLLDTVLAQVELTPFAHERAGVFSRGMAQRLNLARVLMLQPRLLLLDEPATGLDIRSAALLRREILTARQKGVGVVWISHDVAADLPLADRVLALEKGKIAYDGPAANYNPLGCGPVDAACASAEKEGQPC